MPKPERRSLVDGMSPVSPDIEKSFVYQDKPGPEVPAATPSAALDATTAGARGRAPLTTRIRADYAAALKRASLERQLQGSTPNTVQEILEEALEPWLAKNGYLP